MCGKDDGLCFGIPKGVRLPELVGRAMGKIILYQEGRLETNINFHRRSIFASPVSYLEIIFSVGGTLCIVGRFTVTHSVLVSAE